MGITHRQFLLFVPAVTKLPLPPAKASAVLASTIQLPVAHTGQPMKVLYAHDWGDGVWELNLGNPREQPPFMTVRECRDNYWEGDAEDFALVRYGEDVEIELDAEMEPWVVLETWARTDSPNARAYDSLQAMDLGPCFQGGDANGKIHFVDGPHPGSDYLGVSVPDRESLALQQARLDDFGTGIVITISNKEEA